jgi:hypothetical protein
VHVNDSSSDSCSSQSRRPDSSGRNALCTALALRRIAQTRPDTFSGQLREVSQDLIKVLPKEPDPVPEDPKDPGPILKDPKDPDLLPEA